MDERLEKAIEFGNYRVTLANQKKNIITRMQTIQKIQYSGGSFNASPSTISFVNALMSVGKTSSTILDTKEKPVEIEDLKDFLEVLVGAYTEAVNEYTVQIEKLNKARNIKKIMDW